MIALVKPKRLLAFEFMSDLQFLLKAMEDCNSFIDLRNKNPKAHNIYSSKYRLPRRIANSIVEVYYNSTQGQENWDRLVENYYKEAKMFLRMLEAKRRN